MTRALLATIFAFALFAIPAQASPLPPHRPHHLAAAKSTAKPSDLPFFASDFGTGPARDLHKRKLTLPTPTSLQTLLNGIQWTNGRGLVTGATLYGVHALEQQLFSSMGTWDANGNYSPNIGPNFALQGRPPCTDNSLLVNATAWAWQCQKILTPQMFGAVGDGVADDTTAISNWLNAGGVQSCNGSFKLTGVVNVSVPANGTLAMTGSGRQGCEFVLSPPNSVQGAYGAVPTVVSGGSGYILDDVIPVSGGTLAPNGPATTLHVTGLANTATGTCTISGGAVNACTVTYGGTNYSSNTAYPPPVYIGGGGCTGVLGEAVISGGAVTTINVRAGGANCSSAPTVKIGEPLSGPIATVAVWNGGAYSAAPASPVSTGTSARGSTGTGATFNISYATQAAPAGIVVNVPTPDQYTTPEVSFSHFSVAPANLIGSKAALTIQAPSAIGSTDPMVNVLDYAVMPTCTSCGSLEGLRLVNVASSDVRSVACQFSKTYASAAGSKCISLVGTAASTTTDSFRDVSSFGTEEGFYVTGTVVQGIFLDRYECVSCVRGVHVAPSDNNFLELRASHMDMNVFQDGVYLENAPQSEISSSFINFLQAPRFGAAQAGIHYRQTSGNSSYFNAHNNVLQGFQSQSSAGASAAFNRIGILLDNNSGVADSSISNIHDNTVIATDFGVAASNTNYLNIANQVYSGAYFQMAAGTNLMSGNNNVLFTASSACQNVLYCTYNDNSNGTVQQPAARIALPAGSSSGP